MNNQKIAQHVKATAYTVAIVMILIGIFWASIATPIVPALILTIAIVLVGLVTLYRSVLGCIKESDDRKNQEY